MFPMASFRNSWNKGIGIVTGLRYNTNMSSSGKLGSPTIDQLLNLSPGPEMAALMATISKEELSAADRVRLMQAHQKMVSYYQAELYSDMVSLWQRHQSDEDLGEHFALVVSELRAALHLTRRAAEAELETASTWLNELLLSGIRCAAGKSTFDGPRSSATPPSICPMTYGASSSSTRSVTPAI